MNSSIEPNSDFDTVADRLVDSLLSEHARIGDKGRDQQLVDRILLATVNAPQIELAIPAPQPQANLGLSDWLKIAAIVVGLVALTGLVLTRFQSPTQQPGKLAGTQSRQEHVFHIVVENDSVSAKQPARKMLMSSPVFGSDQTRIVPFVSAKPPITNVELAEVDVSPPISQFGQSIEAILERSSIEASFTLVSNDMSYSENKIIYSGAVLMRHSQFIMEADSLVLETEVGKDPQLKALNASLSHHQGDYFTEADTISFAPETGGLLASGVQRLTESGIERVLDPHAVVLFENGALIEL